MLIFRPSLWPNGIGSRLSGTGCEFDSWQCRIYMPCLLTLRLLGSHRGFLVTYINNVSPNLVHYGIYACLQNYISHACTSSPGNILRYNNGRSFSTPDRDNDNSALNCASILQSGWWHDECPTPPDCSLSNLNGQYSSTSSYFFATQDCNQVNMRASEMKFKPMSPTDENSSQLKAVCIIGMCW